MSFRTFGVLPLPTIGTIFYGMPDAFDERGIYVPGA